MVVAPEHLANRFKDATLPAVLATPVMIMAMENAALEALKPYFEPGESAVGTRVDVEHLAATPVGRRIVAHAEVTSTDGPPTGAASSSTSGPSTATRRSAAARTEEC
jgi:fluoroacetyl-CoA thioesterase